MFKKFCLTFLLIIFLAPDSRASFWDDLGGCLSNPCNCGFGNQTELWHNDIPIPKGPKNSLCPPWNKDGGRDDHICLANTPYPQIFVPWHMVHCAESTSESNYFNPKIRIRNQSCNAVACWTMSQTLSWDGECLIWPTPYAFPLLRICARIALPENTKTQTPADPGYTYGKHLDYQGFEEDDEIIIGVDGQPINFNKPKLCAYRDPSILDALSGGITLDGIDIPDLMDFNPMKQPFHKTKELHVIGKIIIFFIDMMAQTGQGLMNMLGSLFDMIGGAVIPNLDFFKPLFDVIGAVIEKFALAVKAIIEEYAQINRLVSDYKFGCVEIPMGPFPPPYCPKLLPYVPTPTTQFVCETASNGTILDSVDSKPCVVSKTRNNIIHNTVRVTFDNFVPLCKGSEDTTKTDKCVRLANIGLFNSASAIHIMTARRDAIKPCSLTSGTDACVETKIPFTCSVTENGCEDGFRIVYATKIGQKSMPSAYFMDDLSDCGTDNTHISCQEIWGVNIGEFKDVTLAFPPVEETNDPSDLVQTFTLKDINNMTRTFDASIVREAVFDSVLQFQKDPSKICVTENNEMIGCEGRAEVLKPIVYSCDSGISGIPTCTSDYFVPRFVISMRIDDTTNPTPDSTSAIIEPQSVNNNIATNDRVNLAGYDFISFVTDDTYVEKPFVGAKAFNPASLFGTYKNDAVPFNSVTNASTGATYLYGLEYMNDRYVQGGKYACAKFSKAEPCPINEKNCVLSNLLNRDLINCNDFFNKARAYGGLRLCRTSDSSCAVKDSVAGTSGGAGITIYQCGGNTGNYCYTNTLNMEVCKISMKPTDRFDPLPDSDPNNIIALGDNDYYHSGIQQDYNGNLYALRDKTSVELSLCASIPQPVCAAINAPNINDNYATWTEAAVGAQSIGTCVAGSIPIDPVKPLRRYCVSNAENRTIGFETLDTDVGCKLYSFDVTNNVNNFPPSYSTNIFGSGQLGGVEFGTPGATTNVIRGTFYSNLTIKIDDLTNVDIFKLTTLSFKDYAIVKVNGQVAYSGPGVIANIINSLGLPSFVINTTVSDIDLKSFLIQGDNDIRVELGVVGVGGIYYKIDYKMK